MLRKACALCSCDIEHIKEPAILFVGKYGKRYEICFDCESLMDSLVEPKSPEDKTRAEGEIYHYLFEDSEPKSHELVTFFRELLAEGSESMLEAKENLEEYEEEEARLKKEAEEAAEKAMLSAETAATDAVDEALPTEDEFLSDTDKPLKLWVKLLFLLLFALLGGGAVAFGILKSTVPMIVIGAIVFLVGVLTLFSKD